ncbi:DUF3558 domain-containing protein [Actinosynnema sp. NPDC020468]|uniref:DUF3558 domain-containing protein n=1 Tax=Actinosynnema sp. NPDC020468 TaxID=3154488 RepID=UPI0033E04F82
MRNAGRRGLIALVVIGFLTTACTVGGSGSGPATLGQSATPTTGTSGTSRTPPVASSVPRPKELKLDNVDPCKVLTSAQMAQLSVVTAERNDGTVVDTGKTPLCDYASAGAQTTAYGVGLITSVGIDYWTGNGNYTATPTLINGYSALTIALAGVQDACAVAIDVADGEQLYVDFRPIGKKPSQDQMCQNAKKAAELALVTLPTLA